MEQYVCAVTAVQSTATGSISAVPRSNNTTYLCRVQNKLTIVAIAKQRRCSGTQQSRARRTPTCVHHPCTALHAWTSRAVLESRSRSTHLGHLGERDDQLAVGQPGADAGRVHRLGHLPRPPQLGRRLAEAVLRPGHIRSGARCATNYNWFSQQSQTGSSQQWEGLRTSAGSAGRVAARDRAPSSMETVMSLRSRPRPSTGTRMSATWHRNSLLRQAPAVA
jgi:hypothetical protein